MMYVIISTGSVSKVAHAGIIILPHPDLVGVLAIYMICLKSVSKKIQSGKFQLQLIINPIAQFIFLPRLIMKDMKSSPINKEEIS